jgi:Domain of Unknown Function (DUF1080)
VSFTILGSAALAGDEGFVSLFNGKDLTGWKWFLAGKNQDAGKDTFSVKDGVIVVSGKPNGYFYTDKSFKNYTLKFDWRYQRPENLKDDKTFPGNSGLLLHITGAHKVWPLCLEVQGENKNHGSFIAVGGKDAVGLTDYKFDKATLEKVRNKVGDWNTTEVTVKNGMVTAKVNGSQVASGKITLVEGPFGFQSEGAELHFKNIKIKTLD